MKINKYSICLVYMLLILILAATAFAQDSMIHEAHYYMDGIIDFRQQVGDEQGTGAMRRQTIAGQGEMDKSIETAQVAGKITVEDVQDWTTAEDALQNLTVTSTIQLCAPGMQEFTTTKYEMATDDEIFVPEGMFLLEGFINPRRVSKVIPLYTYGYDQPVETVYNEEENRFEFATPMRKEPGALIFIEEDDDGNESFLGHLSLSDDLGYIPGNYLEDGVTSIDVGNITFDGSTGTPAYNPLDGEEINIAGSDLNAAAVAGSLFSAIAMSKDLVEAHLQGQTITIDNRYFPTTLELNEPDEGIVHTKDGNIELHNHRMGVFFSESVSNYDNLKLQYPSNDRTLTLDNIPGGEKGPKFAIFNPENDNGGDAIPYPPAGEYRLYTGSGNGLDVNFTLPNIANQADKHLVIPNPTINLATDPENDELYIESITWEYLTADGEKLDKPENILEQCEIQIASHPDKNTDNLIGDYDKYEGFDDSRLYQTGPLSIELNNYHEPGRKIYWKDVGSISMAYDDIFDIHYVVGFENPLGAPDQ